MGILFIIVLLAILAMGLQLSPNLRDASLKRTWALPNGAATTTSASIDTGATTSQAVQPGDVELVLDAPALTTGELADTQTITYQLIDSAAANLSSPSVIDAGLLVQTGAGGAGAAAASKRFRLPSNARRYIGVQAVKAGASNASTKSAVLDVAI